MKLSDNPGKCEKHTPATTQPAAPPLKRGVLIKQVKFILTNYLKIKKNSFYICSALSKGMFFIGRCRVEYLLFDPFLCTQF